MSSLFLLRSWWSLRAMPHLVELIEATVLATDDEPLRCVVSIADVGDERDELAVNVIARRLACLAGHRNTLGVRRHTRPTAHKSGANGLQ
jgi:hypothetical protein